MWRDLPMECRKQGPRNGFLHDRPVFHWKESNSEIRQGLCRHEHTFRKGGHHHRLLRWRSGYLDFPVQTKIFTSQNNHLTGACSELCCSLPYSQAAHFTWLALGQDQGDCCLFRCTASLPAVEWGLQCALLLESNIQKSIWEPLIRLSS